MHRVNNPPDNLFVDGNGDTLGTILHASEMNSIQEELCNVVEKAGLTLSGSDDTQVWQAIRRIVPAGLIAPWPKETPPTGWLEANGAAVSRTTYADLFSAIGTMYGSGDGSTTFNLPDLRGEFLRGWDHSAGNDPDASSRTSRGDGTTGDHVGTRQADELKSHSHDAPVYAHMDQTGTWDYISPDGTSTSGWIDAAGGNETRPTNVNMTFIIKY